MSVVFISEVPALLSLRASVWVFSTDLVDHWSPVLLPAVDC